MAEKQRKTDINYMAETTVGVSVTHEEKAKIKEAAKKMHLTMSAYIRLKVFAEGE